MDSTSLLQTGSAYSRLRDDILKGRLTAGARLVTQRIADELGISRTPVKEALARLEVEGLVLRSGNWGYTVRGITLLDAQELFEARLVIETACARLAAERAGEADTHAMTRQLAASRRHLKARALPEFQDSARGVHELIAQASANSQLVRMFKQVNDLVVLFGISLLRAHPARAPEIQAENESIVAAIQERRGDEAAALMRRHIENGHASFRAAITGQHPALPLSLT